MVRVCRLLRRVEGIVGEGSVAPDPGISSSVSVSVRRKAVDSQIDFCCSVALGNKLLEEKMFTVAADRRPASSGCPPEVCAQ